jgi:gliding motility-associated lipoprotein GldD
MKNIIPGGLAVLLILMAACSGPNNTPKPAGYPRIEFPAKKYIDYISDCPFTFRYPAYAKIVKDSSAGAMPCFLDMKFPDFNGTIHLTYKNVSSYKNFYDMSEDARTFAYKHTVKAEDILDSVFVIRKNKVSGIFYDISGNTASSLQFYATDSSQHYLRGALYFNTHPNKDSLAPVIRFIHADIDTMIRSLRWK